MNMNLRFTIENIDPAGFVFKPTDLIMVIVDIPDDDLNVRVITSATQFLEDGGSIVENHNRILPISILDVFSGFDPSTMLPTWDQTAMNLVLEPFGIKIP